MKQLHGLRPQRGFSLIEVLVAFFVIAVGILGIAKMQALAISNTGIASMRSLAAIQAASLASAMHANKGYWAAHLAPASITISGTTISDTTLSSATDCTSTSGKSIPYCSLPVNVAAYDLQQWAQSLNTLLPNDQATIACTTSAGTPVTCTIQITWSEKAIVMNAATASGPAMAAPTYTLYVQP